MAACRSRAKPLVSGSRGGSRQEPYLNSSSVSPGWRRPEMMFSDHTSAAASVMSRAMSSYEEYSRLAT